MCKWANRLFQSEWLHNYLHLLQLVTGKWPALCVIGQWFYVGCMGLAAVRSSCRPARCVTDVTHPFCSDWSIGPGQPCAGSGADDALAGTARHGVCSVELPCSTTCTATAAVTKYDAEGMHREACECRWARDTPAPRTTWWTDCVWRGYRYCIDTRRPTIWNHYTAQCFKSHAGTAQTVHSLLLHIGW